MSTLSYDATGAARQAHEQHLPALLEDRIATRIFAKDHTLWGPDAEAESAVRLGWVEAATVSQPLVHGHPGAPRRPEGRGRHPHCPLRHGRLLAGS